MNKIRIALVDDHKIFLKSLSALFQSEDNFSVVITASSGEHFLLHLKNYPDFKIDVLILDLKMKKLSGIDCLKFLKEHRPDIKTIVLSMFSESPFVHECFKNGVRGYISKESEPEILIDAINKVNFDGQYINHSISKLLIENIKGKRRSILLNPSEVLTIKELEVLMYICQGLTADEIGQKLNRSKRTIEGHRQKLLEKTDLPNVAALVAWSFRKGLVK